MSLQIGIKTRKSYLALRGFFLGAGLCGEGFVLKNRRAMSSIVNGFCAASRLGFCVSMCGSVRHE